MHKILIVEDDTIQNIALKDGIQQEYPNWNIISSVTYEDALEQLSKSIQREEYFSMFLLDIQLLPASGDMSGFVLAETIRSHKAYFKTPILFLTSIYEKTQFALATYHCYNYITKPYEISDILYQIEQMMFTGYLEEHFITITDTDRITHRLQPSSIIYMELLSHKIILHTTLGDIATRQQSTAELLKQLPSSFKQCHKKYIVNLNFVQSYAKSNGYLHVDETIIPVGRTFKQKIETFFQGKAL